MTKPFLKPRIGFTIGDPGGIGPEIVLRSLHSCKTEMPFIPVVIGSREVFNHPFLLPFMKGLDFLEYTHENIQDTKLYIKDIPHDFDLKKPSAQNGKASFSYIKEAVSFLSSGQLDGLVTAPICKESLQLASIPYTGHTTMLKALTGVSDVSMMFATPSFHVVLATIHIPLADVSLNITPMLLNQKVVHAVDFLRCLGHRAPRIAIAGLNPHAGEGGMLGREEVDIIRPFAEAYKSDYAHVAGPFSADTIFSRAKEGEWDCVLAMYHDQGLIPVKLIHFHDAVNVTWGLPFIRCSPDHGTAFDRAYEKESSIDSFLAAIQLTYRLVMGNHEKA